MPNRILKESICESRGLSEVSFFAEDLYKRLITYADDYGRFNADYQIILARLYPREIGIVTVDDIEDAVTELIGAEKIALYTAQPRKEIYGCFPNWANHQRVRDSKQKFPAPDDTSVNDWYLKRFIPRELKKKIIERDKMKCQECGKYIFADVSSADRAIKFGAGLFHIDHIVPVVQGGRATEENLRLLCARCNLARKKRFTVEEIIQFSQTAESCGELPQVAETFCRNPIQSESESNPIERAQTAKRFAPPSVEDVTAYCRERKNNVDPQKFVDFYTAKGWKVGQNPMKDWRACVRTWEQRERTPVQMPVKQVRAAQYTQRDYDEEDLEARLGVNDLFRKGAS